MSNLEYQPELEYMKSAYRWRKSYEKLQTRLKKVQRLEVPRNSSSTQHSPRNGSSVQIPIEFLSAEQFTQIVNKKPKSKKSKTEVIAKMIQKSLTERQGPNKAQQQQQASALPRDGFEEQHMSLTRLKNKIKQEIKARKDSKKKQAVGPNQSYLQKSSELLSKLNTDLSSGREYRLSTLLIKQCKERIERKEKIVKEKLENESPKILLSQVKRMSEESNKVSQKYTPIERSFSDFTNNNEKSIALFQPKGFICEGRIELSRSPRNEGERLAAGGGFKEVTFNLYQDLQNKEAPVTKEIEPEKRRVSEIQDSQERIRRSIEEQGLMQQRLISPVQKKRSEAGEDKPPIFREPGELKSLAKLKELMKTKREMQLMKKLKAYKTEKHSPRQQLPPRRHGSLDKTAGEKVRSNLHNSFDNSKPILEKADHKEDDLQVVGQNRAVSLQRSAPQSVGLSPLTTTRVSQTTLQQQQYPSVKFRAPGQQQNQFTAVNIEFTPILPSHSYSRRISALKSFGSGNKEKQALKNKLFANPLSIQPRTNLSLPTEYIANRVTAEDVAETQRQFEQKFDRYKETEEAQISRHFALLRRNKKEHESQASFRIKKCAPNRSQIKIMKKDYQTAAETYSSASCTQNLLGARYYSSQQSQQKLESMLKQKEQNVFMNQRFNSYADMIIPASSQLTQRRSSRSSLKRHKAGGFGAGPVSRKKKRLAEMRSEARKSEQG